VPGLPSAEILGKWKMPLLKIARMGHPVLRRPAAPVTDPEDPAIARLAADMIETMVDARGVGLAAPQVYRPLRLIAIMAGGRDAEPSDIEILINPVIEPLDGDTAVDLEGCLSIPDLRGMVPRARRIGLRALGLDGRCIEREAEDFQARVLQHEVD